MSTQFYTLRDGVPKDGEQIRDVHRRSILTLGLSGYSPEEVESWAAGLRPARYGHAMTKLGEVFILAETENEDLAGFSSYRDDEVLSLYVAPEWARQGIGTALLTAAEERILEAGFKHSRIAASLSGQAFYERQGYQVTSSGKWKTRGGVSVTRLDMSKGF